MESIKLNEEILKEEINKKEVLINFLNKLIENLVIENKKLLMENYDKSNEIDLLTKTHYNYSNLH